MHLADITVLETINDGRTVYRHADADPQAANVVGDDRDAHGCIGSAGYRWCEKLGECVRPWELELEHGSEDDLEASFLAYCGSP